MTRGERLIWELFEMVRELMPVTEANTRRLGEWSAKFHEIEHGGVDPSRSAPPAGAPADEVDDEVAEDPDSDEPHVMSKPGAPLRKRKKK